MDSLSRSSLLRLTPFISLRRTRKTQNPKPFISKSKPPSLPLHASLNNSPNPSPKTPTNPLLSSLLKPLSLAAATVAASAALLLSRFPFPSPSLALAAETLTETQTETLADEITTLRYEIEEFIEQGDFPGAIKTVDRLVSLEPDNPDIPLLKGHLLNHNGDLESAKRTFERILEKDPFFVEAFHGLIMTASNSESSDVELENLIERVEKTIESCKKERESKEKVRDLKLLIGQIQVIQGKFEDSLKVYGELVKEEPTDFRPYLCQGIVYSILKKKDEAEKQFEKYKRLVPKGHPYSEFFDESLAAMKVLGQPGSSNN